MKNACSFYSVMGCAWWSWACSRLMTGCWRSGARTHCGAGGAGGGAFKTLRLSSRPAADGGMPEQSFDSVQETVRKAIAMQPDVARIYPLLVIKGTPLAADYAAGRFVPLTQEEAVTQAAWVYRELTEAGVNVTASACSLTMSCARRGISLLDRFTRRWVSW